jgi:hypothetical protein
MNGLNKLMLSASHGIGADLVNADASEPAATAMKVQQIQAR